MRVVWAGRSCEAVASEGARDAACVSSDGIGNGDLELDSLDGKMPLSLLLKGIFYPLQISKSVEHIWIPQPRSLALRQAGRGAVLI